LGTIYRNGNLVFTPDGNSVISPVGNRITLYDLKKYITYFLRMRINSNLKLISYSLLVTNLGRYLWSHVTTTQT